MNARVKTKRTSDEGGGGGGVYIMTLTHSISSILFLSFRIFLVKTSPWPVSIVHTNLTKYQFIIAFSND